MTQSQREIFRDTVLRAFQACSGCGLNLVTLEVTLRACGFRRFTTEEMEGDIQYFTDKGFLAEVAKSHSLGNRIWRITAAGMDDLERRGL
jgi:hypothetical protein